MSKVIIKKSKVQGKGVFATEFIKSDEVVLTIDDSHIVNDPNTLTDQQNEYDCDYLESGKVILMQEPEKYINHSCEPSTYVKTLDGIRTVIAIHDIMVGDEITYDYSINGDNDGIFECHCGSPKCRGVYQGNFFKLPLALQQKYLPYLDDWFVKQHEEKINQLRNTMN